MADARFIFVWPTIRPQMMRETHRCWIHNSSKKYPITTHIAVNTPIQRAELNDFQDVIIVGTNKPGPVHAAFCITQALECQDNPIVLLISDDFYPPEGWDEWLVSMFQSFDGGLMVADILRLESDPGIIALPVMSYNCLKKLNKAIYHPAYHWQYSDAELYQNLIALHLLKIISGPKFIHRHPSHGLRPQDQYDAVGIALMDRDLMTFQARMKLPISERLKCPGFPS